MSSVTGIGQTRLNLAVHHMMAAARFSREVGELEQQHAGMQFDAFWNDILQVSIACVMTATASLEAYANEMFSDGAQVFPDLWPDLLNEIWEEFERKSVRKKFAFALTLRRKPPMNEALMQGLGDVIELRNALVHFKPEWENEAVLHEKLSRRLQGKFQPTPFFKDLLIFPRAWASHGGTTWVVRSCLDFAGEFERAAGLPSKYQKFVARLQP